MTHESVTIPCRSESASFPKATSKQTFMATRFAIANGDEQSMRIFASWSSVRVHYLVHQDEIEAVRPAIAPCSARWTRLAVHPHPDGGAAPPRCPLAAEILHVRQTKPRARTVCAPRAGVRRTARVGPGGGIVLCSSWAHAPMRRPKKRARSASRTPAAPPVENPALDAARPREALVALLVIAVATALAYSNTFDASFHFDDGPSIVANESLRDLRRLWPPSGNRWLGYLSFALNYRLGGLAVSGYHLVNLLIHAGNGLLVFWLAATTLRTPTLRCAEAGPLVRRYLPLAAGLLFALHPVQTQAVTYIVQRFASLATSFYLLSVVLYAQVRLLLESDRSWRPRVAVLYGLALLAAAAAMTTKEISFTLPFAVAGYEWLFFRPRRHPLLLVPLAAIALWVPAGIAIQGRHLADVFADVSPLAPGTPDISRYVYLLTQSRVVVTYLRLLLLPVGQNLDHDFPLSHSLAEPRVLLALAILVAVLAAAVLLLRWARETKRAPGSLVFFGIAWFFVTLSVESSVVPLPDVMFEHRLYLPSAGASVSLATVLLWVIEQLRFRATAALQAGAALLLTAAPLGVATYARNFAWKDDLTLWTDVVAKSPRKALSHTRLADAYRDRGQLQDAIREYREAIRIAPGLMTAHNNLGYAYEVNRQLEDAAREYAEAIRLAPDLPAAHVNLGNVYCATGQLADAAGEYREAARLDPRMAAVHTNLGNTLREQGRAAEAVEEHRVALVLRPTADGVLDLAVSLEAAGRIGEAIVQYRRFLDDWAEKNPDRAALVRARVELLRALPEASFRGVEPAAGSRDR